MNWIELSVTINGQAMAVREEFDTDRTLALQSCYMAARLLSILVDRELVSPEAEG